MKDLKQLAGVVLCISLSVVGSMLKLPTGLGSIALDSAPALVAGALLGKKEGALVAALGHLSSAWFAGFPLGMFHGLVALEMGIIVYLFGWLFSRGWKKGAYTIFWIGNALIAPLPFLFFMGSAFVVAIIPALAIGTAVNMVVAFTVIPALLKIGVKGKTFHA
ncbi:putative membrane protein [Anoxybacillus voinovskiensis]|uniref:Putative membrane protein n=1 Tax=Anoxybacteroides voinovskiense TaxID=230470 RepID=A0A840DIA0_9BACL|nr:ECF transporter S component [Anoxybacillus voinovskiensis]MBB4073041.1 putative membrane protein [Anoxybacillus voinovskiensis]GGJ59912.1 hypothetical protein GCM10008982_06250 [Anoxybacillus voinovskiensis]